MKTKLFTLLLAVAASVGITSAAITVRLDSRSCTEWSKVYIWAWTNSGNIFPGWPGEAVSKDAEGWYTYTFASNISSVNILWSDGSNQTTDITGITASTCYALNGTVGHVGVVELVKLGDLYYYLNATDRTAEVRSGGNDLSSIIIPASITYDAITYSVTCIGSNAFRNCSSLTSVTIPNSVTSIGKYAFFDTGLTSIIVENGNTVYDSRNDCNAIIETVTNTLIVGCPNTIIPNSVTSIGHGAFYGCSGLTSITIPNSVTSIGSSAFDGCTGLTSVTIPNSVTSIGELAFEDCSSLTSVTIGNSVTSIGEYAFYGCSSLTSVTIGNSVTSIGEYAFYGCSINTINFTGTLEDWLNKEWSPSSISNNYRLLLNDVLQKNIIIPNSVTSIGKSAFGYCSGLTSVTIPNSVTSIGESAFFGCTGLTSVTIPNSVTSIGNGAFEGCTGLTSVTIPNSVTSIGELAFEGCSSLTSVTIGNSVTSIGEYAFYGCTGLTSVTINSGSIVSTSNLRGIFGSQVKEYIIGDDVTIIGRSAFEGCSGLTSVTIGNSVTSIGDGAFSGCTGLTSIDVASDNSNYCSVDGVLFNKDKTTLIQYPRGKQGAYTIPNSVTSIGDVAFSFCTGLTSVTIEAKTPPALGNYVFGFESGFDIYVPCGTLDAYKSAWSEYAFQIKYSPLEYQITGNVNIEGAGSVQLPQNKCEDVISATPNNGYHFTQWSDGLKENPRTIELTQDTTFTAEFAPDRVGTCGKDLALVWSYDPNAKVLTISNTGSLTENMKFGVEAPNEMEELVIGNSVTAIGANAFAGIETLKKVSIGESVKTIGEQAFYNCVNLETIFNYRPTPTNAYSTAFDGVDKFECKLYVLPSSIDMYKAAAVWRDFYYNTYAIGAEETTVTTNDVQVEPQDNAATFTWPTSNNVASYTIQITKDGVVFCTLTFNANGQLTGIAFAPSRDGQAHAPSALMTANGLQFTVTGLNSNTQYGYNLTAKDANDQTVATYSGSFTTTSEGVVTGVDNVPSDQVQSTKFLRGGKMYIIRGEKVYNAQGAPVK